MPDHLDELGRMVEEFGTAPKLEEMPRRLLADKGINGPTAAHVIEEVHTPFNLAYLTFTTGSTAFQNIVGVTFAEMPNKISASKKALELAGVKEGSRMLVTYPPLVNVFTKNCLEEYPLSWSFLRRSSRDDFLYQFCRYKPDVIVGESTFFRASLEDAKILDLENLLPRDTILLTAGTPLDLELLSVAEKYNYRIFDLYGCQEFGWLTINGIPLRRDVVLAPSPLGRDYREFVVGGMPMGDSFIVSDSGHVCNKEGKIITYRRERTYPDYEVIVKETPLSSPVTLKRAARTILRIKGRVVKVAPELKVNREHTVLELVSGITTADITDACTVKIEGPDKTMLFDDLVQAQIDMEQTSKTDPIWNKKR